MEEIWKPVKGYEGYYEVSSLGRVRALSRIAKSKNQHNKYSVERPEHLLKLIPVSKTGYMTVLLCPPSGSKKKRPVHRLVAEAFIPNPLNLPCVNHKDEDKGNNTVSNLEWCTYEYNNTYGTRLERIGNAQKKPVAKYDKEGNLLATYPSAKEAAAANGVAYSSVIAVAQGNPKQRSAAGYIYKYLTPESL